MTTGAPAPVAARGEHPRAAPVPSRSSAPPELPRPRVPPPATTRMSTAGAVPLPLLLSPCCTSLSFPHISLFLIAHRSSAAALYDASIAAAQGTEEAALVRVASSSVAGRHGSGRAGSAAQDPFPSPAGAPCPAADAMLVFIVGVLDEIERPSRLLTASNRASPASGPHAATPAWAARRHGLPQPRPTRVVRPNLPNPAPRPPSARPLRPKSPGMAQQAHGERLFAI